MPLIQQKKAMNRSLYLALLWCISLGCTNQEKEGRLQQIEFLQAVRKQEKHGEIRLRDGEYYTFSFFQNFYLFDTDTCDYSHALYITFPVKDSLFSFKNDSTHLFQHIVSNVRGEFYTPSAEEIDSAQITGRLLEKGRWEIAAKTKYFDFKRIVTVIPNSTEREAVKL